MIRTLLLAGAIAACAAPAAAQFTPGVGSDTAVVSELVVKAVLGPPWWKVSDGDTTVYIFADPGALPYDVTFDRTLLDRRLRDANELILSPRFGDNIFQKFTLPVARGAIMGDLNRYTETALEPSLPPDLRARFVEARLKARQPEGRYGGLPPGLAGMAVAGDYDALRGADNRPRAGSKSVEEIVLVAANTARIGRVRPARLYGRKEERGIYDDLYKPGVACLASTLDTLDLMPPNQRDLAERDAAARAWAQGDVKPLLDLTLRTGRTPWLMANGSAPDDEAD